MPPADPARAAGPSRSIPRLLVVAAVVLLAARVVTGVWEARRTPPAVDRVEWVPLVQAEAESRRTGKPVLYDFSAEWCGPCRSMQAELFSDPGAAEQIGSSYVPVRVTDRQREDGRNAPEVDALQKRFGVTGFPTLVVAVPGATRFETLSGYRGADATERWLVQTAAMTRARGLGVRPDSTFPGP